MRLSAASIWRQVAPPSSERYRPKLPMMNIRWAFVFMATATDVRAERAAGLALLVDVSLGRDQHEVRVARIDQDRGDLSRAVEAQVLPGLAGIDRLVDAVAFVDAAAGDQVAHADVDHVSVGGGDFEGADRGRGGDVVEDRRPGFADAGGFPDAAEGEADVEDAGLADGARDRRDAPAANRPEVAPDEPGEEVGSDWRATRGGAGERTERDEQQ